MKNKTQVEVKPKSPATTESKEQIIQRLLDKASMASDCCGHGGHVRNVKLN